MVFSMVFYGFLGVQGCFCAGSLWGFEDLWVVDLCRSIHESQNK